MNSAATWARMICNNLNSYRALNSTETWPSSSFRAVGIEIDYEGERSRIRTNARFLLQFAPCLRGSRKPIAPAG